MGKMSAVKAQLAAKAPKPKTAKPFPAPKPKMPKARKGKRGKDIEDTYGNVPL